MVKINYNNIRSGDLVFCTSNSFISNGIRFVSSGFKKIFDKDYPTHVGIVVEAYGQKYIAEMMADGLELNSLESYNKNNKSIIVDIRRNAIYNDSELRLALNYRIFKDLRYTLDYDYKGILEFVCSKVKDSKSKFYCSEYVKEQTKVDGIKYSYYYDDKVSPLNLYNDDNWLDSVEWKLASV